MSMSSTSTPPPLLRLPAELRSEILTYITSSSVQTFFVNDHCSDNQPVHGFLLQNLYRKCLPPEPPMGITEDRLTADSLVTEALSVIYATRLLQPTALQDLATKYQYLVNIDVRQKAPTGANDFARLCALDETFRQYVRSVTVVIYYCPCSDRATIDELSEYTSRGLLVEKIVENVVEIMSLFPGCRELHLIWIIPTLVGNHEYKVRKLREPLVRRLVKEVGPHRQVFFSAAMGTHRPPRHCMKSSDLPEEQQPYAALSRQFCSVIQDGDKETWVKRLEANAAFEGIDFSS